MQLNRYIDHTLLKADTTEAAISKLCEEAKAHQFFSVCVNTGYVATCKTLLKNSEVKVCCVIGFPLGAMSTLSKADETKNALSDGADEFDMVINIGFLKDHKKDAFVKDVKAVVNAAAGKTVKAIIETSLLTQQEKQTACEWLLETGAHFVKTSTGFGGGGATVEDVLLMKKAVHNKMKVKASGGIKSLADAENLLKAGAERLGTSSGVALVSGQNSQGGY